MTIRSPLLYILCQHDDNRVFLRKRIHNRLRVNRVCGLQAELLFSAYFKILVLLTTDLAINYSPLIMIHRYTVLLIDPQKHPCRLSSEVQKRSVILN